MASVDNRPLGQQTLRGFGIFQAIVSIPTMVILGFFAWEQMVFPYREDFYSFFAPSMTAFMAAGIVFIVYVQRKAIATPYQVLMFELQNRCLQRDCGFGLSWILHSAHGVPNIMTMPLTHTWIQTMSRDEFSMMRLPVCY